MKDGKKPEESENKYLLGGVSGVREKAMQGKTRVVSTRSRVILSPMQGGGRVGKLNTKRETEESISERGWALFFLRGKGWRKYEEAETRR